MSAEMRSPSLSLARALPAAPTGVLRVLAWGALSAGAGWCCIVPPNVGASLRGGHMAQIRSSDLDALRSRVAGTVAGPRSPRDSDAGGLWKGGIHPRPPPGGRCAKNAGVARALTFSPDPRLAGSVPRGGPGFSRVP